jgi:phosphoribosylformylglycinamidine synthase
VPQRETDMTAYEIMLSESQERMLLVAERGREEEVSRIFAKWGLDAVVIGHVIKENKMRVLQHGEVVAEIPNQALTDDAPLYQRPMKPWQADVPRSVPAQLELGVAGDLTLQLKTLLASPNICSKRWIHEQYDSMVQTNTVDGPGGDAGVMRIKGTWRALAMSLDCNGRWCWLDPKLGAMHAVAEAARNVACTGATPVAATNCLNFGNPEKPEIMWQLSEVVDGVARACEALGTPITGGNVSLYNETLGEGIYPTPVVGVVGILDDVELAVKSHFSSAGCDVILVRSSKEVESERAAVEFGSSEYAKEILGSTWGYPPSLDLDQEASLQKFLILAIRQRLVDSAHDCSEGGLAVALAEAAFPLGIGADVKVSSNGLASEIVLFGEQTTQVVISCDPKDSRRIQQMAVEYGLAADLLGQTISGALRVQLDGNAAIAAAVSELKQIWESALPRMLHVETREHLVPEVLQKS